jgi:hypothetical protein
MGTVRISESSVYARSHVELIMWEQPQLVIGGKVLSNGEDWTSDGPAQSGIAYVP